MRKIRPMPPTPATRLGQHEIIAPLGAGGMGEVYRARDTRLKRPPPPGASKQKDVRYLDIYENDELDEAQTAKWLKQAAALPGWRAGGPS